MADGGIIAEFAFALGLVDNASKPLEAAADTAEKTAEKASVSWSKAGKGIATAFAAIASAAIGAGAGLFALIDKSTESADAIAKASRNAGIGAEEFQKLAHAGGLADVSSDTLGRTVQKLNQQIEATRNGAVGPFDDALRHVGLTLNDLGGTATENLGTIFDALNRVPDEGRRAALAIDLLGKGGREMGSLIAGGSEELKKFGDQAEELGLLLTGEELAASEAFQDSLSNLKATVGKLTREIGISLAPEVEEIILDMTDWVAANKDYLANDTSDAIGDLATAFRDLAPSVEFVTDALQLMANVATGVKIELAATVAQLDQLTSGNFQSFDETRRQVAEAFATDRQNDLNDEADRRELRAQERAAKQTLADQERLLESGPIEQSKNRAARQTLKDQERLLKDFEDKQKGRGRGGARKDRPVDFDAEDVEEREAEELLGEDIDRLARQVGASDAQRQEAISAAARSLAGNASASVALKAAKSRLESLTGATLRDKESDPFLSEVFGEDVPDVQLSQLALGAQPQTLIATINNSFAFDVRQEINGAGNPAEVASQVNRQIVEVWENAVEKSTKLAKVRFRR